MAVELDRAQAVDLDLVDELAVARRARAQALGVPLVLQERRPRLAILGRKRRSSAAVLKRMP